MRHTWRTALAVAIAGLALVATVDVGPALADDASVDRLIATECTQGVLTVCAEKLEYECTAAWSFNFTYPRGGGLTYTPECHVVSKTYEYKDFISSTPVIVITGTRPRCTKTPSTSSPDGGDDGTASEEEDCVEE